MKVVQAKYNAGNWKYKGDRSDLNDPLVFVFADRYLLEDEAIIATIKREFPYNNLVFGSTAGEICNSNVEEGTVTITAIEFEKSNYKIKTENIKDYQQDSKLIGEKLITQLPKKGLKHVFVLSEGSFVNGSALIEGLESNLDNDVVITGGMCGDGSRFEKTLAGHQTPKEGEVVLIGFYGETIEVSYSSVGGWIPFGPERVITSSKDNVLFELDGKPALELYSKYLGEKASELPQASLLYPLHVKASGKKEPVVRTILGIDTKNQSMTLAGDVPQGSKVQLMMASADGLVEGAYQAAKLAMDARKNKPELAILVSCIGRKLVLDQRVEEEIEGVIEMIGNTAAVTGFYSYGELAPYYGEQSCELHNQTMTLTLLSE
ncbi:Uncharacterized conserved protein, contains FIST_N domain [Gillisia sp. Hel1_33_143]|uniref:FIST signal transduction protein n=1 Tax=Gillisia sp. Hel1_33_143 TaxID=1336796 RepID=UPI00087AA258|nr:FIST N-terminal domain-containing protein [Gillisia sp. Hel1_33_143]SDR78922.1 Uncharacterized conserved protein, contains FIST_N domain [Gillisia sp. Hel1_33_143]